jgi:hypothetical protein
MCLIQGNAEAEGTYQHLQESGLDFAQLLSDNDEEEKEKEKKVAGGKDDDTVSISSSHGSIRSSSKLSRHSSKVV